MLSNVRLPRKLLKKTMSNFRVFAKIRKVFKRIFKEKENNIQNHVHCINYMK